MEIDAVPAALRQRLGPDATVDLVECSTAFTPKRKSR